VPPRRSALTTLLREALRVDRTQSDPVVAARNAIGVAAPLAIGMLAGSAALGLSAAIGALQTAFADRPGPYRLRMLRMFTTAGAAAITSGVAVFASRSDAASVCLLAVLAFVAGLLLAGGPSATQVGVAAVAAALVLGHLRSPPSAAWHVALLVLAGGAGQAVLAIAAWPLRRHRPERVALAGLYRELATAARRPAGTRAGPPAGDTLGAVRQTLYGLGHDHGPSVEAYRVLLDEGERIRREIIVVIGLAERLARRGDPIMAGLVRGSCSSAGDLLAELADALAQPRRVDQRVVDAAERSLAATIDRLKLAEDSPAALTCGAAAGRLGALSGQLRAAVDSVRTGASEGARGDEGSAIVPRGLLGLRNSLADVRANLSVDSTVARHAARLSLFVAGSDLVVRLLGLERGYWVSLTVLVVLRPDFGTTLQRSFLRVAGTLIGLVLASELVRVLPTDGWWQVGLIAVLFFGMRLAGPGNVGLSAVALSAMVVILLEINGVPAHTTETSRALATVAGGALAVIAVIAWPSWERQYIPARLAKLLTAYRDYVLRVADLGSDPSTLQRARSACRVARTNAQASVDRTRAEPVAATEVIGFGESVLAHTHRFVHATVAVEAMRPALREVGGVPALETFLAAVAELLDTAARAVTRPAGSRLDKPMPPLRPLQEQIAESLTAHPEQAGGSDSALTLIDATDRIANSLDTLLDQLRPRADRSIAS
jgi:uncharacterized membrane protein YccC